MKLKFVPITERESRKILLQNTLVYYKGHKRNAAKSLGVTPQTIYNWMNAFGLFSKWKTDNWRPAK